MNQTTASTFLFHQSAGPSPLQLFYPHPAAPAPAPRSRRSVPYSNRLPSQRSFTCSKGQKERQEGQVERVSLQRCTGPAVWLDSMDKVSIQDGSSGVRGEGKRRAGGSRAATELGKGSFPRGPDPQERGLRLRISERGRNMIFHLPFHQEVPNHNQNDLLHLCVNVNTQSDFKSVLGSRVRKLYPVKLIGNCKIGDRAMIWVLLICREKKLLCMEILFDNEYS